MALRDALLALGIVALWALNVTFIRVVGLEAPPLLILGIRFALVALLFLPFARPFARPIARADLKNVLIYAFFYLILHLGALFIGLKYIDAGTGGLILQSQVAFAVLIGWVFYGEKFGVKTAGGLVLALGGVVLILAQNELGQASWLGSALVVISALSWATGSVRMRGIKEMNFTTMSFYSHLLAAPVILALSALFESNHIERLEQANHWSLSGIIVYQAVLMTLCLYWWKGLMNRNRVYKVTSFVLLQPIFTVIFGLLLLGESPSLMALIGGALAFGGVVIVTLRRAGQHKTAQKS